jgi:hypothetical protein
MRTTMGRNSGAGGGFVAAGAVMFGWLGAATETCEGIAMESSPSSLSDNAE